uniref:Uncharacterized protein n=1 Tax=Anguilla anguilla TaxID=7936 RepID=A0A0E9VCG4_ANGAN
MHFVIDINKAYIYLRNRLL